MRATHVFAQKVFYHLDNKKETTSLKFSVLVWRECLGTLGAVAVVHARMVTIFPCFSVAGHVGLMNNRVFELEVLVPCFFLLNDGIER